MPWRDIDRPGNCSQVEPLTESGVQYVAHASEPCRNATLATDAHASGTGHHQHEFRFDDEVRKRVAASNLRNEPASGEGKLGIHAVLHFRQQLRKGLKQLGMSRVWLHDDAPEFDAWQCAERERLAQTCLVAAERAAERCDSAGDGDNAIAWWRKAAALEPHNSRIAHRLVQSLVTRLDHVGAIRAARAHTRLLAADYGIEPPAELTAYLEELRRTSPPGDGDQPDDAPGPHVAQTRSREVLPIRVRKNVTDPDAREHPSRRVGNRRAWMSVSAALLLMAGSIGVVRYNRAAEVVALDPTLVVVLPFRTAGLHPELAYLGEGLVDLMATKLTGEAGGLRRAPLVSPW